MRTLAFLGYVLLSLCGNLLLLVLGILSWLFPIDDMVNWVIWWIARCDERADNLLDTKRVV